MEKYSLEIASWGSWELERDFSSIDRAKRHAEEHFPQNEWLIFDRIAGSYVHHHDPFQVIQAEARLEARRFQDTQRWRQVFAERAAAAVVANQQRERMAEIAARQRARQRDMEQQRRERLRGFNFVGSRPSILELQEEQEEIALAELFGMKPHRDHLLERVNWLKEGF